MSRIWFFGVSSRPYLTIEDCELSIHSSLALFILSLSLFYPSFTSSCRHVEHFPLFFYIKLMSASYI